jgi:3-methylfumaryl-CoA hydratase
MDRPKRVRSRHDHTAARSFVPVTLDRPPGHPAVGDPATLGVHWGLAPPIVPMEALGDDGHPRRGGFLPPVPLPWRTWAGGELAVEAPLQVGDIVTRTSQIKDVAIKEGRSGTMCFVTVRHSWATLSGPALEERQDIVYRAGNAGRPAAAIPAEVSLPQASCQRVWPCDPVLLFRYSALTFNGHRIHYDYPYVTEVEGYPGLTVHGPLQATLLMGLSTEAGGRTPRRFAFRGVAPLFAAGPFVGKAGPNGEGLRLWIEDAGGRTTITADASW